MSISDKISWDSLANNVVSKVNPLGENLFKSALVEFLGFNNSDDWRVKLTIPFNFISASAIFEPLAEAGGFIFPYTPEIAITGSAEYDEVNVTHQNYPFLAYKYSRPGEISITGDFNVQDSDQALYWIACMHFLRTVTKMFTSGTTEQGSPPPILFLHGYGDFVFDRIPVVVKSFSISLPKDCDYISTKTTSGINMNRLPQVLGGGLMSQPDLTEIIADIAGAMASSFFKKGSHVPTKSTINVVLQPAYSRTAVKNFSLAAFSMGGYMRGGYV
jgi:hypothetical protein